MVFGAQMRVVPTMQDLPLKSKCKVLEFLPADALPGRAHAETYPVRRVMVIVPFAAGGSADVYARLLAPALEKEFGQPFIVDDRPDTNAVRCMTNCK